jgi:hypothetical protein
MAGSCWRLLAAFLLIFMAPAFLRGQGAAADRSPGIAPVSGPDLQHLRYSSPTAPVWIPPPGLPRPYAVAPGRIVFQQLVFRQLVSAAGIIFSGQVTFIGRRPAFSGQDHASTTVTFQVEHAIRGVSPGQKLTIHEWAGLWTSGERYYVGERVLLFLYSPGKLGLTSPVAGAMGRFALDSRGAILMSPQHVATLAGDTILGGKTVVPYADFAQAVRRSSGEQ